MKSSADLDRIEARWKCPLCENILPRKDMIKCPYCDKQIKSFK